MVSPGGFQTGGGKTPSAAAGAEGSPEPAWLAGASSAGSTGEGIRVSHTSTRAGSDTPGCGGDAPTRGGRSGHRGALPSVPPAAHGASLGARAPAPPHVLLSCGPAASLTPATVPHSSLDSLLTSVPPAVPSFPGLPVCVSAKSLQ